MSTYLGYIIGGFDIMLQTLIIFIIIDYVTGIISAICKKNLSSDIGFKGIFKKIITLLLVGIATRIEIILGIQEIRYVVISFYLANEGLSILENSHNIGIPIPKKIVSVLEQFKEDNELEGGDVIE
jgi:toxin secretion/phage lysis holin